MKENKTKIMFLANDTTYLYNTRIELLKALFLSGRFDVVIVAENLYWQETFRTLGCHQIDLKNNRRRKNPLSDLKLLINYLKTIDAENPDIVLSFNIKPNIYGGIACRIKNKHYIPNITGLGTAVEIPGLTQILSTFLYKLAVASSDCIFFQNTDNISFFKQKHILRKDNRVILLPGSGVNLDSHGILPYPRDDEEIHFLFIARILREKGIDLYLEAAKCICEKHNNVLFHICGKCDDEKYIKILREAQKTGYIVYHDEQRNIIPFYELAHCVVHPSYYPEGMSNVLLEAAAHGRPIITTDRAGCRETVDDEKSGYIIPIKNEEALVNAIETFLGLSYEQKKKMGLAGRRKVETEFDRNIVVNEYLNQIKKSLCLSD